MSRIRSKSTATLVLMGVWVVMLAACGAADDSTSTSTRPSAPSSTSTPSSTVSAASESAPTTTAEVNQPEREPDAGEDLAGSNDHEDASSGDGTAASSDQLVEIEVVEGAVLTATREVEVDLGSTVSLIITSDVTDEVHVHGYDHLAGLEPGVPTELVFDAVIPGVFEVELEGRHQLLVELVIR